MSKDQEIIKIGEVEFFRRYSNVVPAITISEYGILKQDIQKRGILVPIIVDENYVVIDGIHRLQIAQELRFKQIPFQIRPGLSEEEKWELAQDLNLHRRHLTQEQIIQIVQDNREKLPQMALMLRQQGNSLRQIGEELGVSHQQVQNLIQQEATVKDLTVELPETIKGKDGKKRPAKKPVINVQTTKELQRGIDACQTVGSEKLPQKPLDLKRAERLARESERKKLRQQEVNDFKAGKIELLQGDFNIKGSQIPDNSIDCIFTDPPYDQASLPLWGQLAKLAKRVLKPSGLFVSYSGSLYIPKIHQMLGEYLTYLWIAAIYHSGAKKKIYPVGMNQAWKPILIYYKEPKNIYWPTITDMVTGGESKQHHDWEQSVVEASHYINAFCPRNSTLLDPMMGSGTSLIAGLQSGLGLRCIGIELDKGTYADAEQRVKDTIQQLQSQRETA